MKILKFEREARLLGPGKELPPLCRPITPQATQAHNRGQPSNHIEKYSSK